MTDVHEGARRFCRFRSEASSGSGDTIALPNDGMCLSAFLLVSPPGDDSRVLLGRVDPTASWRSIGALSGDRLAHLVDRWMLPSSQLLLYEGPDEAARRIVREQLEFASLPLTSSTIFSEAYRRDADASPDPHWDLHFVYRGQWPTDRSLRTAPWTELRFHSVAELRAMDTEARRHTVGRGHIDILDLAYGGTP